ncbi:hypothetical protein BJX70DRAFT_389720 [Aspergillus crustosus]
MMLWNKQQQLACRYVKFNLLTLLQLAASAISSRSCTQVLKISEGQYNKAFQLTMDGREIIAKLLNPNTGRTHYTTASEVATMDFLRNVLDVPVPRVYAWSSRASENPLSAEYILLEKQAGVIDIERWLAATKFSKIRSIYYKDNLPHEPDSTSPLYLYSNGKEVRSKAFSIRSTNHRSFCNFKRGEININHGPWSTVSEYLLAIAKREIVTAKAGLRYPLMPEEDYLKVAPHVLLDNKAIHALQSISTCLFFIQARHPGFLDCNSPVTEGLGKAPLLPDFNSIDLDNQQKAKALHRAQPLHNLYLTWCLQSNKSVFQAIQGQNTLRHQVSIVPGLVLMDYEPLLHSLLQDVEKEWAHIVPAEPSIPIPFPIQLPDEEIQQPGQDGELWAQGVKLMNVFVGDTGCFKHWDGRVSGDIEYEESRRELKAGVKRFLDREARNEEEQREWRKVLPFVD